MQQPLIVAVCGDSGSGKTTLTAGMVQVFGQERVTHICLDDYHILDRVTRMRTGITALCPEANDFALMTEHLRRLAHGEAIVKPVYDHRTGTFANPVEVLPSDIIIVHGLHPLYTEELRNLAHVGIYLDPETALLAWSWRRSLPGSPSSKCASRWPFAGVIGVCTFSPRSNSLILSYVSCEAAYITAQTI